MRRARGCLALDVDGTLTDEPLSMPLQVVERLEQLHGQGWRLLFLTGRTASLVQRPLSALQVPYVLAAQQGSLLIEWPSQRVIRQWRLPKRRLLELASLAFDHHLGVVAYGGWGWQDTAWTHPSTLLEEQLDHVARLESFGAEPWQRLDHWEDLPADSLSLIKLFGAPEDCQRLEQWLVQEADLHVSRIRDPFQPAFDLLLVTHPLAHKGHALQALLEHLGAQNGPVIAAGNDGNDVELLREADYAIAMKGSPPVLLAQADWVAPPCRDKGILQGLDRALDALGFQEDL